MEAYIRVQYFSDEPYKWRYERVAVKHSMLLMDQTVNGQTANCECGIKNNFGIRAALETNS